MSLAKAISAVLRAETGMAEHLRQLSARHASDADIDRLSISLVRESEMLSQALAPFAAKPPETTGGQPKMTAKPPAEDHTERAGQVLLDDLCRAYATATQAELAWVILKQAAAAARNSELGDVAGHGQNRAQQRWQWLRGRIKEAAPQVHGTRKP
jgi:hypothetical protein